MKFKYVKEFDFPADRGFRGSNKMPSKAGASERGMPARVGKAVGAPRMESMPRVGKAQGYAQGGSVKKLADGGSPLTKAQQRTSIRNMGRYVPRDYLTNPNRIPTEREMSAKAAIRQSERITREAQKKVAQEAAREAAKAAALKTVGKVAARAIPGVGAALTAYDVGKYAYNKYQQNQARKKPTVTVQQVPDSGAPPARGGGGGMGITSGGAMARGMPTSGLPALPDTRGTYTITELPETGGMKRGGSVKGKKIAKVMREYKEGKLHSGSKKGPVVKNPKQAMAIALSEAGASKKAKGGIFNDEYMAYESKGPKTRGTARKGREQGRKDRMERLALEKMRRAEKYAPGLSLDMSEYKKGGKVKHSDVKMDKAMVKKAVHKHERAMHPGKPMTKLKHGGVPSHGRKPMYGGGKC